MTRPVRRRVSKATTFDSNKLRCQVCLIELRRITLKTPLRDQDSEAELLRREVEFRIESQSRFEIVG